MKLKQGVAILSKAVVLTALTKVSMAAHFSGPFLGAHAGGAVTLDKYISRLEEVRPVPPDFINTAIIPAFANQFQLSKANVTGGVDGGYDFRLGSNLLIGAEAFYDFQNQSVTKRIVKSSTDVLLFPVVNTLTSEIISSIDMTNLFSAALRLGILPTDSTLIYGNLGIPFSKFNNSTTYNVTLASTNFPQDLFRTNTASNDSYHAGYLLGVGIERYISNSFTIFANYRYNHFKTDTVSILATEVNMINNVFASHRVTQHNFLLGVNSRFEV